ncbi:hypothetical protein CEXT_182501 [Caerostris extrusa]|uniref:Uncharacterized protein n=1 Tax=Caerostris extrusa TaxID=172846 RepID=A0AAV4MVH8_CAEEX|nr:hypothetical protein CEXT_182501 [Caerostris extrusa]
MKLQKWCANHIEILPNSDEDVNFSNSAETRTSKTFRSIPGNLDPARIWRLKIDWSDTVLAKEKNEWRPFLIVLNNIGKFNNERKIIIEEATIVEPPEFAESSERCSGAAVYCKS